MGFTAEPAGMEGEERQAEYRRRNPGEAELPVAERRALLFPKLFGDVAAPAMLPGLSKAAAGFAPAVLIHDPGEFASAIVAGRLGVPHVTHGFGALTPSSLIHATSEEVAPLWESAGLSPRPYGGTYDYLYLDIFPPALRSDSVEHVPRYRRCVPSLRTPTGARSFRSACVTCPARSCTSPSARSSIPRPYSLR